MLIRRVDPGMAFLYPRSEQAISSGDRISGLNESRTGQCLRFRPKRPGRNGYSWLSRKAPSPLRSPGLPPSLITP